MKLDSWEQALSDAMIESADVVPKGCITIVEFGQIIKKSHSTAIREMRRLVQTGKAELAGRFLINSGSRLYPVLHYRLKNGKRSKA